MFLGISKAPSAAVGLSVKAIESAEARAVVSLFVWRAALAWAIRDYLFRSGEGMAFG